MNRNQNRSTEKGKYSKSEKYIRISDNFLSETDIKRMKDQYDYFNRFYPISLSSY